MAGPSDAPDAVAPQSAAAGAINAGSVDGWLRELGLEPLEHADREGVASWDLLVDGRRRRGIRLTLILDPSVALLAWVHFAPPLPDTFRKSYHQFLRWNDELPFVKFALAADERPVLTSEVPAAEVNLDSLGITVARLVVVCDLLLDDSVRWLWPGAKAPPEDPAPGAGHAAVLDRYADQLAELTTPVSEEIELP